MSYRVTMDECNFYIKSENLDEVLKRLINSDYCQLVCDNSFSWTRERMLNDLFCGGIGVKKLMLDVFFKYKKYQADYDEDNNIIGLYHTENVWNDDTDFFAVFAELVEAGSCILYSGEEHEVWRIYFLGEDGCEEENGKLVFPDHSAKSPKNVRQSQLKKCIFLELGEFENIVCNALEEDVTVEYTLEGLDIYTNEDGVPYETITNLLTKHFCVEKVTSFHSDHCEDCPGVWVVYKDGSEVQ